MKKYTVVTHNGQFHADDIFAVATLSILLEGNITVLRTRDENVIEKSDYVVDVGGIYEPSKNRFDHHQVDGAGKRDNAIPYAAFGLVWKSFGEKLCGSKKVADIVEARLVMPIDAGDNGFSIFSSSTTDVSPYQIQTMFSVFRPTWKECNDTIDDTFLFLVEFAEKVLRREIVNAQTKIESEHFFEQAYQSALDKRLVVLDVNYPWDDVIENYPQVLYVVQPKNVNDWRVCAVRKEKNSFINKKDLPREWAGKKDTELVLITGVSGARFCHNGLFVAAANDKDSAIQMAKIALES